MDGNLITGHNPASSVPAVGVALKRLKSREVPAAVSRWAQPGFLYARRFDMGPLPRSRGREWLKVELTRENKE